MASISSLTGSSSTSSIYGTRNVISGLASGLDTETLIENAVSGYKTKIQSLQQKQTQVTWKQDAYRSIIDKMVGLNRKYTSYTSDTNLFSQSFFNKAVTTTASGENAKAVTASGRTNSSVAINRIQQLASSAKYKANAADISIFNNVAGQLNDAGNMITTTGGDAIDLSGDVKVGALSGSMTLTYGSSSVYLSFTDKDVYANADELKKGIEDKLSDALVKDGKGNYVSAADRIKVDVENGKITFSDKSAGNNSVYISSASDSMKSAFGVDPGTDAKSIRVPSGMTKEVNAIDYLKDKSMSVTFNGSSKTISFNDMDLDEIKEAGEASGLSAEEKKAAVNQKFVEKLNEQLKNKFGQNSGVNNVEAKLSDDGKLSFSTEKGSTLQVTSAASKVLGLGEDGVTSYLNTSTKLGDFAELKDADGNPLLKEEYRVDSNGNVLDSEGQLIKVDGKTLKVNDEGKLVNSDDKEIKVDYDGNILDEKDEIAVSKDSYSKVYGLEINGEKLQFDKNTTLESMMTQINGNKDAGVNISYSKLTNQFSITSKETGSSGQIEMKGTLAQMFGSVDADGALQLDTDKTEYAAGQDAIFDVTVNGEQMTMKRSSNTVDFDGMTVTLNKTFGYDKVQQQKVDADGNPVYESRPVYETVYEEEVGEDGKIYQVAKQQIKKASDGSDLYERVPVMEETTQKIEDVDPITFSSSADSDKIVDAIQSFVNDYNAMVKEIREQYATQPAEKSSTNHTRYMPLTDDDKEGMSDDAIAAYEEKAKQGILFGSSELAGLHDALRNAISGIDLSGNTSSSESALFNNALKKIGITTSYSNGLTTLELDTQTLRDALSSDPDSVRDVFAQTKENGARYDGLMQRVQKVVNQYANTSSGSMGILISQAGSALSPTSINNNALQDQYDRYTEQIEKIQDQMSDRVDYYTRQFTALEQLMSQMNNQSSMLSSLMGGGTSY